jgi:hypothetical protein
VTEPTVDGSGQFAETKFYVVYAHQRMNHRRIQMANGQIKLFNGNYGVIQVDERGDVLFFSGQSCSMSPRVGDRVTFGVRLNPKSGQREAVEITPQAKTAT